MIQDSSKKVRCISRKCMFTRNQSSICIHIYIYIPGTQMTLVLVGKGPCFEGLTFKNRGHLGSRYVNNKKTYHWTYYVLYLFHIPYSFLFTSVFFIHSRVDSDSNFEPGSSTCQRSRYTFKLFTTRWWQLKHVLFSPLLGQDSHFDKCFFKMGGLKH